MGDVVPFRKKRRWTTPEDYGHFPDPPPQGGGRNGGKPPRKPHRPRFFTGIRPLALLVVLVTVWVLYDPALYEPPAFLAGEAEAVTASFTRCGPGRGVNCVIDGDTFRLGDRKIRLIGIDAPETHPPRCPAEAQQGEAATAELQRLLNEGPFVMTARIDGPTDRYGRELRALSRQRADGTRQSLAADLLATGKVRPYRGGLRNSWC